MADGVDDPNRLTESRCRSGGLVEERGRELGGPMLDRGVRLGKKGSFFEGGTVG